MSSDPHSPSRWWWLLPAAVIVLSVVPVVAGTLRTVELITGADITPHNARYFASPLPILVHIPTACLFCVLGAFQFVPQLRRRGNRWHRLSGRAVAPLGLVAAGSGLWMTAFYADAPGDGALLRGFRLVFGSLMTVSLALGLVAVRRRDFGGHRAWMIRGYALGMGVATQLITNVAWLLLVEPPQGMTRTLLLGASWMINLALAEWIIRRTGRGRPHRGRPRGRRPHPASTADLAPQTT